MFKRNKKIIILVAVMLLIFLHFTKILRPIENLFLIGLNPVISNFYSVSSNLKSAYVEQNDKRDLTKIVKRLEEENKRISVENAKLKTLESENRKLRQHLRFLVENNYNYTLANVVSRENFNDEQSILIDKGRVHGVEEGLAVVDSYGMIVGKIAEVKDRISKIHLITSDKCKIAASIQNRNRTIGVAEGELGLTVRMKLIPQIENIEVGANVVSFGFDGKIPRGLLIGKVKTVEKDSNEVWQEAIVEPLANLRDLTIISVLFP